MVRITRRDFLKYCSVAAGALGLSASTMMKVEKVLASNAASAPVVIWIAGSACTGCTMSLLNTVFYTTVDDLLINRINLTYLDTAMAAAGAYDDSGLYGDATSNPLIAAQALYASTTQKFVLVVEGAIPTEIPPGSSIPGDYCRIGDLTGDSNGTVWDNVQKFAAKDTCLAVLSVGTCASFGGIPGAQGNLTGAKGVAFSGTTMGGAIVTDAPSGRVTSVIVNHAGSGYAASSNVTFNDTGTGGSGAAAKAYSDVNTLTGFTSIVGGSNYTTIPTVTLTTTPPNAWTTPPYATAIIDTIAHTVKGFVVTDPGSGITSTLAATITGGGTGAGGASATPVIGTGAIKKVEVTSTGSGYTKAPTVSFIGGTLADAYAAITITKGDVKSRKGLAAKVINISGCPPHPDWIVGTIAHILDTHLTLPSVNSNYQPVDYGYKDYQCNAGPCPWRYNNNQARSGDDYNARYPEGNSKGLALNKWKGQDLGCIGVLGCKGRKTKADCSRRRWNSDEHEGYGVNWCVGSRSGCHGCTQPAFPDKVGKFFTFV
jgi:Ni,Fe-hydrogenase I small subunit